MLLQTDKSAIEFELSRRQFFNYSGVGLASAASMSMLPGTPVIAGNAANAFVNPLAVKLPHFSPRAKHVIYLFMAGGPSQLELFDNKPRLRELNGEQIPDSYVPKDNTKRFAFIKNDAPLLGARRRFRKHGQCGMEVSSLLPYTAGIVDELALIKTVRTDNFNHGPAKLLMNTGFGRPGRPGIGAWTIYGLGSEADNLPSFVVLTTGPRGPRNGTQLYSSGFLPTIHQGVPLRNSGDPILGLTNPSGISRRQQRQAVDAIQTLNAERFAVTGDGEITTRIAAYEMAFRMQSAAPEMMDFGSETLQTLDAYGAKPSESSFANNCLLARRLVERGVRFVQLFHTDWDHHGSDKEQNIDNGIESRCREIDQPCAALISDLRERGLLDDTLVVWGGEFGRTPQAQDTSPAGRDHHIETSCVWMAGGGIRGGQTVGQTDELGFFAIENPLHVNDLHATILHQLGLNHERLTYRFQGRDFRLTDVGGNVIKQIV